MVKLFKQQSIEGKKYMRSFFTEPENVSQEEIILTEDLAHMKKVLRMEAGDEALVFDGTGAEYTVKILEIGAKEVRCSILEKSFSEAEPRVKVSLYQGIPKSDKMEQIIQKCTELGIGEIIPVKMDRCVAKLEKGSDKIKRWQKISREATKQSGRGVVPKVKEPISFKEALDSLKEKDLNVMPYEILGHEGKMGLHELLRENKNAKEVGIIIGPEGGFSDGEAKLSEENGINMIGLGKRILRTETAGSTLLSVIMYEFNEF